MNNINIFTKTISGNKYYNVFFLKGKPIIIYKDHRFVVPILWLAHKLKIIPPEINMVRFDHHMDYLLFNEEILTNYPQINNFDEIFNFSDTKLAQRDDDWLTFILEVNLINKCLSITEDFPSHNIKYPTRSYGLSMLDGSLGYQGDLSDHARDEQLKPMWDVIGWNPLQGGFISNKPILLDIDCDYFTFRWRDSTFAWLNKMYKSEFDKKESTYFTTNGWSQYKIIKNIIERATFITIALEPDFCGGESELQKIICNLNTFLFEDNKSIKKHFKCRDYI